MILQALTKLYEDLVKQDKIGRPGWAKAKISYALCITEKGRLEQIIPLFADDGGKKPRPRQFNLPAPVKRSSGVAANFLWDNSSYLLGVDQKGKPERSRQCFEDIDLFSRIMQDLHPRQDPLNRGCALRRLSTVLIPVKL